MLHVIGKDFAGYELHALFDDGAFGVEHWRAFKRIAVVGDQSWIHAAVSLFRPFLPCQVRLFGLSDLPTARAWLASA